MSCGASIDSNVASVSIYPPPISPTISPSNITIINGQPVTFSTSWTGNYFPYNVDLYSSTSTSCTPQSATEIISGTVYAKDAAGGFTFPATYPKNSSYYCIVVSSQNSSITNPSQISPTGYVSVVTNSINSLKISTPILQTTNPMVLGHTAQIVDSGASGGSGGYIYQLFEEAPGSSTYDPIGVQGSSPDYGIAINTNPGVYHFEIQVTDSSGNTAISGAASLDVIQSTTTSSTTSSTTTSSTTYPTTTNSTTNGTIIYVTRQT